MSNIDYSKEPWWNSFTKAEQQELAQYLDEHPEEYEKAKKERERYEKVNKPARNLFGWG